MQYNFMQSALLATLLLTPLTAAAGIQVVNYRMAFFADTISHSAFAGAALGVIFLGSTGPAWSMPILAILIGIAVLFLKKSAGQSSDTVIGVIFAFVVSLGLLLVSTQKNLAGLSRQFLFGDILLVSENDIALLALLDILYLTFMIQAYNPLLLTAIDDDLARAHRVKTSLYKSIHIMLLALIVIFAVKISGVLLAGAMLIVPAAAAGNIARSAGSVFFYAMIIGVFSGVAGLLLAAGEWANLPAGAAMVMLSSILFAVSVLLKKFLKQ